jgi:hypothetical protein
MRAVQRVLRPEHRLAAPRSVGCVGDAFGELLSARPRLLLLAAGSAPDVPARARMVE